MDRARLRSYEMAVAFRYANASKKEWEEWEESIFSRFRSDEERVRKASNDWEKLKELAGKQGRKK